MAAVVDPIAISPESARKANWLGWGLIALGFAIPALAASLGYGGAFEVGESIPRSAGALLVLGGVAWVITRNLSPRAKANGRIVVGLMLCANTLHVVKMQADDMQASKAFFASTLKASQRQNVKFIDLGARFDRVDLAQVLTPQSLTSAAGIQQARATMAQYRTLLLERKALLRASKDEAANLIAILPSGSLRDNATRGATDGAVNTAAIYDSLDTTQDALATALENIIDWSEAQAGKLAVRDNQLLFSSEALQAEMRVMLTKLTEAEGRFTKASENAARLQAEMLARSAKTTQQVNAFLSE